MDFLAAAQAEWAGLLAGVLAFALGGLLKGATGAGAPVIIVPVIALFFDVPTAVVMFAIPNLLTNIWQGWAYRRDILPGPFAWLFGLGGFAGALIGTLILVQAAPDALSLVMAAVVFCYVAFRLSRPDWRLDVGLATRIVLPVGLVAGTLQGSTGISAPVSITFVNAMRLARPVFMGVMSIYFMALALAQIPLMVWFGLMDWTLALLGMAAVIPMTAAMPVGAWLGRRIPAHVFDKLILSLLSVIALKLIWESLAGQ